MKIDWKRKLTSRKFWAAVCGFVSMWIMALWKDASIAQTVTGMIMSAASLIAYMIGEGLADGGRCASNDASCGLCGNTHDTDAAADDRIFAGARTESASDFTKENVLSYEANEFSDNQ